jgi:hypothetical protein
MQEKTRTTNKEKHACTREHVRCTHTFLIRYISLIRCLVCLFLLLLVFLLLTRSLTFSYEIHFIVDELDQLEDAFRKLSIRSMIINKYRQLIANHVSNDSICRQFVHECRLFLHEYGCLLDRHTYKIFKQNLLLDLEQTINPSCQRMIHMATEVLLLIKPVIELRLKQKQENVSSIPIDVLKKLNLEPIEETINENENKKLTASMSTTQIYGNYQHRPSSRLSNVLDMKNRKLLTVLA